MSIPIKIFPTRAHSQVRAARAFLGISLSNQLTKSTDKLTEILHWLSQNVGEFDVIIGDYFQRHNLEDLNGYEPREALAAAIAGGLAHANRIQRVLESLTMKNVKIRMASDICEHADFAIRLDQLNSAMQHSTQLAHLIDQGTNSFLQRIAPQKMHSEHSRLHSRMYQLEEMAMFTILLSEGYRSIVYVGAHLPVMKAIVNGDLEEISPILSKAILVGLYKGKDK